MEPIILASSSPRRQELLNMLGIPYQVVMPDIDETIPEGMNAEEAAEHFATKKIHAALKLMPQGQTIPWILSADTLITLDGKIYGKPNNQEEARSFLKDFSGKEQEIISAIAFFNGKLNYLSTRINKTKLLFSKLSNKEIDWYINTGEWHGVAGGYRIQGLASCFIEKIKGSFTSVVGLPLFEFYDILKEQGYPYIKD
ncbi:MAG TPA: Maf family protein [Treponemataceae bacterium]|nr:Maf family protein [Treponemataceae bacterium]HPY52967.1 Maf family protein [Treponemataceae bacterium]HUH43549.1 Maf family protein [Treponemataceae bacterium]